MQGVDVTDCRFRMEIIATHDWQQKMQKKLKSQTTAISAIKMVIASCDLVSYGRSRSVEGHVQIKHHNNSFLTTPQPRRCIKLQRSSFDINNSSS